MDGFGRGFCRALELAQQQNFALGTSEKCAVLLYKPQIKRS